MAQKQGSKVGKTQLLTWLNNSINSDYQRIEELGDCLAYSILMDKLHPRCIPMKKLIWNPQGDEESLQHNNEIFKTAFDRLKLNTALKVGRLNEGRFSDNLRLLQWFNNVINREKIHFQREAIFTKRCKLFKSSKNDPGLLNHLTENLIPNQILVKLRGLSEGGTTRREGSNLLQGKLSPEEEMDEELQNMQNEVARLMEFNWKIMHGIQEMNTERNFLYGVLRGVENILEDESRQDPVRKEIVGIIKEVPEDVQLKRKRKNSSKSPHNKFRSVGGNSSTNTHPANQEDINYDDEISDKELEEEFPNSQRRQGTYKNLSFSKKKRTVSKKKKQKMRTPKPALTRSIDISANKTTRKLKKRKVSGEVGKYVPSSENIDMADKILQNLKDQFLEKRASPPKIDIDLNDSLGQNLQESKPIYDINANIGSLQEIEMELKKRKKTQKSSRRKVTRNTSGDSSNIRTGRSTTKRRSNQQEGLGQASKESLQPINKLKSLRNKYYKQNRQQDLEIYYLIGYLIIVYLKVALLRALIIQFWVL